MRSLHDLRIELTREEVGSARRRLDRTRSYYRNKLLAELDSGGNAESLDDYIEQSRLIYILAKTDEARTMLERGEYWTVKSGFNEQLLPPGSDMINLERLAKRAVADNRAERYDLLFPMDLSSSDGPRIARENHEAAKSLKLDQAIRSFNSRDLADRQRFYDEYVAAYHELARILGSDSANDPESIRRRSELQQKMPPYGSYIDPKTLALRLKK